MIYWVSLKDSLGVFTMGGEDTWPCRSGGGVFSGDPCSSVAAPPFEIASARTVIRLTAVSNARANAMPMRMLKTEEVSRLFRSP